MALRTETRILRGVAVVRCKGPLVFGEQTTEFHLYVKGLLTRSPSIVLNLEGVCYMDSSGMGVLIGVYISALNAGGGMRLVALTPDVRRVLEWSKLLALFEVYDNETAAIASCRRQ